MLDQLLGEVEQKVLRLKKTNNAYTKRCMIVPSVMRHSRTSVVHSRRKNGSSRTHFNLLGQWFELAYSHFNLLFLKHWFGWSFGRECDAYDKLGSGKNKKPMLVDGTGEVAEVGLYGLFSSDSTTVIPNLGRMWICSSGLSFSPFPDRKPRKVGYWKSKLDPGLLESCVINLQQWRFSYSVKKDVLYYSNSLSVSLGLPPNAKHLGFPKICLDPNFDLLGGVYSPNEVEIGKDKEIALDDAMGQITEALNLDTHDEKSCRGVLRAVFKNLEWNLINRFCYLVYLGGQEMEKDSYFLWLDSHIRKLVGESKF